MTSINKVLIAIDDESNNKMAIDTGVKFAAQHNASVLILGVAKYSDRLAMLLSDIVPEHKFRQYLVDNLRGRIEQIVKDIETRKVNIRIETTIGIPFIEFINKALSEDASLIVQASHPQDKGHLFFSSTDWNLMRKSPIPTWVIKSDTYSRLKHVTVALDVINQSDHQAFNKQLLDLAATIACKSNAHLSVISAWQLLGLDMLQKSPFLKITLLNLERALEKIESATVYEHKKLRNWLENNLSINMASVSWHIENANARDAIPTFLNDHDVDLVVMGTISRTGIPGLLIGNTAETILSKVRCSVVTMKPSLFDGSITMSAYGQK